MAIRMRGFAVAFVTMGTMLVGATHSEAGEDPSSPTLTPLQQERLKKIQAQFLPGGKVYSSGYGLEKSAEFCGANIPMEIHPSTVAYEPPRKQEDRTDIPGICNGAGGAVAYMCGYSDEADPVIKEMIRNNVKRVVCKYTKDANAVDPYNYQKWELANGALTFTCLAGMSCGNLVENGMKFLRKNVKQPNGLSIGGQEIKRKALADLTPRKSTLLKSLKEECNIDNLSISYDDKRAEHFSYNTGHNPISTCDAALQSVYNFCGGGIEFGERYNMPAVKAALQKNLKGISCVYSETESIAWKPGGILEVGGMVNATRPKWEGRTQMSVHDYFMNWMNANHRTFTSQPAGPSAPSGKPGPAPKPAPKPSPATKTIRPTKG